MRTFPSMTAPKINILCGYLQNYSFIRRVPPYYQFFWANFDDFQKMAAMLLVIFIYQIIHDSGWLTCLMLLWNPPLVVNIGVKAKPCFIIWFLYTPNLDCRGCHAVTNPHLPNYTWFWMIIMFSITVTPSTSGQYEGKSKNVTFYPTIGFQYTTFHKGIDLQVRVIQCNMVNEDNLWSLKVIQSRWIELFNFTPKLGWMARLWEHHRPKNLNASALIW